MKQTYPGLFFLPCSLLILRILSISARKTTPADTLNNITLTEPSLFHTQNVAALNNVEQQYFAFAGEHFTLFTRSMIFGLSKNHISPIMSKEVNLLISDL